MLFTTLAFLVFLPLYVIYGVAWRVSVLAGHPVDEVKNKKWRMGFLISFAVFGTTGIILGIVSMGNARHFNDVHGVSTSQSRAHKDVLTYWYNQILGLLCLIFLIPTVGFSVARLRTAMPHPSPRAFVGLKGPIELAKSPHSYSFFNFLHSITSAIIHIFTISVYKKNSALDNFSLINLINPPELANIFMNHDVPVVRA